MTILIFLAVLVSLILVHEFGHFFVAKKSGIRVDEFGIGFPPKLFSKKIGETEYTLNALPLGGFVRIFGEDPTENDYDTSLEENKRSFVNQPKYIQVAVLAAGVLMNILFAFFLYVVAFSVGMPTAIEPGANMSNYENVKLLVTGTMPDTPAFEKLKLNDEIIGIQANGKSITNAETITPKQISDIISSSNGEDVKFDIIRRGEKITESVTPQKGIIEENPDRFATGFSMSLFGTESAPFYIAIEKAFFQTYESLKHISIGIFGFFGGIFKGTSDFSQVSGPVGIVGMVGDVASLGFTWLLTFSALISLNLAVINLLPFPALDGGRIVFVLIEAITGKPIKPIVATRANQIGFLALLVLMAVVTYNDIIKIF
jgi:regulator of sigma E protease